MTLNSNNYLSDRDILQILIDRERKVVQDLLDSVDNCRSAVEDTDEYVPCDEVYDNIECGKKYYSAQGTLKRRYKIEVS